MKHPEFLVNWIVLFALVMVGAWLGYGMAHYSMHRNAIEQSCAFYDMKTGEFTWGQPQ